MRLYREQLAEIAMNGLMAVNRFVLHHKWILPFKTGIRNAANSLLKEKMRLGTCILYGQEEEDKNG